MSPSPPSFDPLGSMPGEPPPKEMRSADSSGDWSSITDGRIVRFAMTYSAQGDETQRFHAKVSAHATSYVYALSSFAFVALVIVAMTSGAGALGDSFLADIARRQSAMPYLVWLVGLSGLGTVVRSHLQGVVVGKEGVESRSSFLGVPRVRTLAWTQIHRVVIDPETGAILELWNNETERLPLVRNPRALAGALLARAVERNVTVTSLE